ncbi:MAG: trehalose-6-phosphate synthase [Fibrobacteria bacterium]
MRRLIIVSNRLPFTISEKSGKPELQESSGGLVTALGAFLAARRKDKSFQCLCVGWPGGYLAGQKQTDFNAMALEQYSAHPVWMLPEESDQFYHGFCNRTLWPLFHYLPSYTQSFPCDADRRAHHPRRDEILIRGAQCEGLP